MSTFEQLIEQHHVLDFQNTVELALQQYGPKLRPFVSEQPCTGEASVLVNLFDEVTASRRVGRKPENLDNRAGRRRRWLIYDDPIESAEYIDEVDLWRQSFDATSSLITTHAMAVGRGIDQIILDGLTGDAYEGKRGETKVALPTAQKVGIQFGEDPAADVGMTVNKLRQARKLLEKARVDLDREIPYVALSADEHDALLDYVQVTSDEFQKWDGNLRPVMREGEVRMFLGLQIVRYQGLKTNAAGTVRYCPVWVKSGLTLGVWSDVRSRMWNDSSRNLTPYINIDFVGDARRTQDGKVVEIACKIP